MRPSIVLVGDDFGQLEVLAQKLRLLGYNVSTYIDRISAVTEITFGRDVRVVVVLSTLFDGSLGIGSLALVACQRELFMKALFAVDPNDTFSAEDDAYAVSYSSLPDLLGQLKWLLKLDSLVALHPKGPHRFQV
jgi:hypothetical protein